MNALEKLAYESQHYELGGGKIRTVFAGNRPSSMTMAQGSGLTPKQVKNLNHWVASKEVTDPEELKAAAKILMRENKGRLGGKPLFGRKRRNYSQLEEILAKKVEKTAAKKLLITKLARVRGSWLFGRTEAPPSKPKPAPKGVAMTPRYPQVPIVDPNSGRIFSHKERYYLQSLPKKLRGPSWKHTEPANQQPGMPDGPVLRPKTDAYFWSGRGGGKYAD